MCAYDTQVFDANAGFLNGNCSLGELTLKYAIFAINIAL